MVNLLMKVVLPIKHCCKRFTRHSKHWPMNFTFAQTTNQTISNLEWMGWLVGEGSR